MTGEGLLAALADASGRLRARGVAHAVVGGLAVSVRGEVRFTRDVDLAIVVDDDTALEALVRDLRSTGYRVATIVEQDARNRVATVRLLGPQGITVDLLAASSGIEAEVVARATPVGLLNADDVPVAASEELIALKVLSMSASRPQDRLDIHRLLDAGAALDIARVEANLLAIVERGFDRGEDVRAKWEALWAARGA